MPTSYNYSVLRYTSIENNEVDLVIPTIQNIDIKQNNTILAKPTITGDTLAQYTNTKPISVTINILLQVTNQSYTYGGEDFTTSELLGSLNYIDTNKITFDLITTDATLSPYLHDLVIQSKTFTKSASRKDVIICSLSCIEIKFAEIGWEVVPAEVLGVVTDLGPDDIEIIDLQMKRNNDASEVFAFQYRYLNTPGELVGQFLWEQDYSLPDYYLELKTGPIDLTIGPRKYIIDTSAALSGYTNTVNEDAFYDINFGNIIIEIDSENPGVSFEHAAELNLGSITPIFRILNISYNHAYNILNQYSSLEVTESFDTFIDRKKLMRNIDLRSDDLNYIKYLKNVEIEGIPPKSHLIVENFNRSDSDIPYASVPSSETRVSLLARDIESLYSYTITLGDYSSGGIIPMYGTAKTFNCILHPFTNFNAGDGKGYWFKDANAEYISQLLAVTVGTKLYIFLLSPSILRTDTILE